MRVSYASIPNEFASFSFLPLRKVICFDGSDPGPFSFDELIDVAKAFDYHASSDAHYHFHLCSYSRLMQVLVLNGSHEMKWVPGIPGFATSTTAHSAHWMDLH